ncbi:MAG: polyprenyl synthetase family protein [Verrucomicrobia bacterium]|nr:polyprenyl synthetase family protein [Verrucomicrobiota bacterium]NBY36163.1 polyprenyl synthetase family protein [Verrucomicrobiota bacterium]
MDAALFQSRHETLVQQAEIALKQLTPSADTRPARLHAAMRYSLEAGGKRLRPVLCLAAAQAFDSDAKAETAAVALECIHTYSLIHDDLPCMDNSDLRRGRPSCHKAFDEAIALLAGDALIPLAFELITKGYADQPTLACSLVAELSKTAGSTLLVGGQTEDMGGLAAGATDERLEFILLGKTAAMLSSSLVMGAMIGGANKAEIEHFSQAGRAAGIAFQLVDDVLDLSADANRLGKPVGTDSQNGKLTYANLHGIESTRQRISTLTDQAIRHLQATRADSTFLAELITRMASRDR